MKTKRVQRVVGAMSCLAFCLQAGCSFMEPATQTITILASDPAAEISVDGRPVGRGTAVVNLPRKRSHTVVAQVDERAASATIDRRVSTIGMLDLVGGFVLLVPWIGVLAPGFWTLDPESVIVTLPPPTEKSSRSR